MNKFFVSVFIVAILFGCNSGERKPKSGNSTIAAIYKNKDGSSDKKDVIKYDTL